MGDLDALASSSFKTAPDGHKLFFPWGILSRGYVIASERDYRRLQHQVKAYYVVSLAAIIGFVVLNTYIAVVIGTLLVGFYLVWMRFLLPRLQPSGERLSLQESMTTQSRLHNVVVLWLLEIAALVFVGNGVLLLIIAPAKWLIGLVSVVLFGLCAIAVGRMLVLRRASAVAPRPGGS